MSAVKLHPGATFQPLPCTQVIAQMYRILQQTTVSLHT